jgi:WD40 repeat protein
VAGEESLTIWRFADRQLVHRAATDFGVENVAFTHDGRHVAGGSRGQRARFWRVEDGREVASVSHDGPVFGVQFDAEDRFCLLEHAKGARTFSTAWLWQPDHLLALARESVTRSLTQQEWATYLGDEPYDPLLSPEAPSPAR